MHSSTFFRLFPPPAFLLMPHVGIDISDDAITFVEYAKAGRGRKIAKYGRTALDSGIIEGGDVKDLPRLIEALASVSKAHDISYAKVSIPEEKAYLFETDIPYGDMKAISQNIEFKLEENVPLAAPDAVFAFDVLSGEKSKAWRASVSVVPRTYIEHMLELLQKAGITPVSFETVPRAMGRLIPESMDGNIMVIHSMRRKTGVYVVSKQAVGFTSTIAVGSVGGDLSAYADVLAAEAHRVYSYWLGKAGNENVPITRAVVMGNDTVEIASALRDKVSDILPVDVIDVWSAIFDVNAYVPPISKDDSSEYAPSAGLAL